jgi:hypothetical protein
MPFHSHVSHTPAPSVNTSRPGIHIPITINQSCTPSCARIAEHSRAPMCTPTQDMLGTCLSFRLHENPGHHAKCVYPFPLELSCFAGLSYGTYGSSTVTSLRVGGNGDAHLRPPDQRARARLSLSRSGRSRGWPGHFPALPVLECPGAGAARHWPALCVPLGPPPSGRCCVSATSGCSQRTWTRRPESCWQCSQAFSPFGLVNAPLAMARVAHQLQQGLGLPRREAESIAAAASGSPSRKSAV